MKAAFLFVLFAGPLAAAKLELPPETADFKPGPGVELARARCLACHSADYVSTQPRFGRAFWKAGVDKMRDTFGADVPAGETEALVSYLASVYGSETASPPAAPASASPPGAAGAELAARYRCLSCHSLDQRKTGPSFKEVAFKYRGNPEGRKRVALQILHGGSGRWGSAVMPSNSQIPSQDVRRLAAWILSLDSPSRP